MKTVRLEILVPATISRIQWYNSPHELSLRKVYHEMTDHANRFNIANISMVVEDEIWYTRSNW